MTSISRIVVSLVLAARALEACSCVRYPTTCEALSTAKVAFVGTVLEGTEDPAKVKSSFGHRPARLAVEKIVRGLPEGLREVMVNPAVGSSCYTALSKGDRVLIISHKFDPLLNMVYTAMCSGSRPVDSPLEPELDRMISSFLNGPNLFVGSARFYKDQYPLLRSDNFAAGVEVSLEGEKTEWRVSTGESGAYRVEGLPPGEYRFKASKPGYSAEVPKDLFHPEGSPPGKVVIPDRGCVEVPILLWPPTAISGTVRDVDGNPISGIKVTAYQHGRGEDLTDIRSAQTDENGRYEVARLLPGEYVVGFNAFRGDEEGEYPATFHPAASTSLAAMRLTVAANSPLNGIDITVPRKRKEITVFVQVQWPDGRPVERAIVEIEIPGKGRLWPKGGLAEARTLVTDRNGIAAIRVREATEYILSATWSKPETKPAENPPKSYFWNATNKIRVNAAPEIKVTLTMSDQQQSITIR
jgi:protocatechuate 3,4-dioxygenase beta subunit